MEQTSVTISPDNDRCRRNSRQINGVNDPAPPHLLFCNLPGRPIVKGPGTESQCNSRRGPAKSNSPALLDVKLNITGLLQRGYLKYR